MSRSGSRRRWRDLTPAQRTAVVVAGAAQLTVQAVALRDLRRRPDAEVRGPKPLWAALSFVNFAGPLAYLRWGRRTP